MFPCNPADSTTVEKVRSNLRGWSLGRALFVSDAGINSEDNRQELGRACGKYLLAFRMANVAEIKRDALSKRVRYTVIKDNLQAEEVIIGDGGMRKSYFLCFNPKEAERQRKHRARVLEILEKELARSPNKKATAQWAIGLLASQR